MNFNSDNISVFPTRNRLDSVDRMARFMHESNIASVGQALTQKSAFVVSGLTLDEAVLKNGTVWIAGRLFSTGDVDITSLIGEGKKYIYMSIEIGDADSGYENEIVGTDDEDGFYDGLELNTADSVSISGEVVLPLFEKVGANWVRMAEYRYPHDIDGIYAQGKSLGDLLDEYFEFGESISIKKPLKTGKVEIDDTTEASDTNGALVVKGGVSVTKKIKTQSTDADSIGTKGGVSAAGKVKGATIEGDIKDTTTTFTESTRTNISTGEKTSTIFGKIKKWLSDLKAMAFKASVGSGDIDTDAVTEAKIENGAVVASKLGSDLIAIGTPTPQNGITISLSQNANKKFVLGLTSSKVTNASTADNAVTRPQSDNSTNISTTAYVRQAISDVKNITEADILSSTETVIGKVRRQVNFVLVDITVPSFGTIIGNIPEGFRPKSVAYVGVQGSLSGQMQATWPGGALINGSVGGSISTNGDISVFGAASGSWTSGNGGGAAIVEALHPRIIAGYEITE